MRREAQIEVRRVSAEEADAVAKVLYDSFAEFKPLYTDGGFAATALGVEQVCVRMEEGPVWVALRENVLLGTVSAVIREQRVYIRGMAVLPSARGSGAGAALLQQAEKWAAEAGCSRVFLSTTPFLSAAIHLYEKCGFRRKGDSLHDLFGTPLFDMEKTISP